MHSASVKPDLIAFDVVRENARQNDQIINGVDQKRKAKVHAFFKSMRNIVMNPIYVLFNTLDIFFRESV